MSTKTKTPGSDPEPITPNDPDPKYRPKLPPLDYEFEGKRLARAAAALDFIQKYVDNWLQCPEHFKVYDLRQLALAQAALVHARRELHKLDCEVRASEREAIQKARGTDPKRLIKRTYQILGIPELFAEYMTGEKTPPEPKSNEVNIWCHDLIPPGQEYLYPQYYPGRDFSKERAAAQAAAEAKAAAEAQAAADAQKEDSSKPDAPKPQEPKPDAPKPDDAQPAAPKADPAQPEPPSADSPRSPTRRPSAFEEEYPDLALDNPAPIHRPAVDPDPTPTPAPSAHSPRPRTRSADELPEGIIRMPSEPRFFPNSTFPYVGSNYRDIRRHPLKPSEQAKPEQSGNPPQTGNPNQDPSEPQA